eukprot:scaffold719_cov117-Cylindrotheca_fusiformis.AAC.1
MERQDHRLRITTDEHRTLFPSPAFVFYIVFPTASDQSLSPKLLPVPQNATFSFSGKNDARGLDKQQYPSKQQSYRHQSINRTNGWTNLNASSYRGAVPLDDGDEWHFSEVLSTKLNGMNEKARETERAVEARNRCRSAAVLVEFRTQCRTSADVSVLGRLGIRYFKNPKQQYRTTTTTTSAIETATSRYSNPPTTQRSLYHRDAQLCLLTHTAIN